MNNNMNYTINNNFCDRETAKDIIDFCLKFGESFSYNPTERWDCRRIYDDNFKTKIIDLLTKNYKSGNFKLWFDYNDFNLKNFNISLTAYYDGRYLNLHKDTNSELTAVIVLSDEFEGGEFALCEDKNPPIYFETLEGVSTFNLKLGDVISFNGSTTYHGVLRVTRGIRYALNIWMTESDFNYPKIKNNKTLL
jgi:Rps23 Pro-64 3,4-dihydroxylase Tpa1-like proline 4-hydroxylase